MRKIRHILFLMLSLMAVYSCETIFEYPDENAVDPTLVNLNIYTTIDAASVAEFTEYNGATSLSRAEIESYYLRTKIQVYETTDLTTIVAQSIEYTPYSELETFELNTTFELNARKYTIAVWSDVVDNTNNLDLHFDTQLLNYITHTEPYTGASDLKHCFSESQSVDLTTYVDQWNVNHYLEVEMERPLARYEIISNDLEEFISNQIDAKSSSSKAVTEDEFEQYTIKLSYSSYVPYGYNVFTDVPNYFELGVSYTTNLEVISDSEARIAFDHILVNHSQVTVYVTMEVYDADNNLITGVSDISIPLLRNQNTVITGDFLTRDYSPGVTINPSFDGEFNVWID